jgi:hypothetical protein
VTGVHRLEQRDGLLAPGLADDDVLVAVDGQPEVGQLVEAVRPEPEQVDRRERLLAVPPDGERRPPRADLLPECELGTRPVLQGGLDDGVADGDVPARLLGPTG